MKHLTPFLTAIAKEVCKDCDIFYIIIICVLILVPGFGICKFLGNRILLLSQALLVYDKHIKSHGVV